MIVNGGNFLKFPSYVVALTSVLEMDIAMEKKFSVRVVGMGLIATSLLYHPQ
jgi:hypothetical protein